MKGFYPLIQMAKLIVTEALVLFNMSENAPAQYLNHFHNSL